MNGIGLVHVNADNPRSRDGAMVIQEKNQPHSAPDMAHFQITIFIYGAL